MSHKLTHVPYFYIIEHIPSGMNYAGSKWEEGCHPDTFMTPDGYTTSSTKVNDLILVDGLSSFRKVLILTEFGYGMSAYEYETVFLQTNDIANDANWLNGHNNDYLASAYGSPEFKENMMRVYGVENASQSTEIKDRKINTLQKNYGVDNYAQTIEFRNNTSQRQTGEGNSMFGKPSTNGFLGKHHTKESIEKISAASSGENNHWYGVTGEDHPLFGRKHTEEQNKKKSERMIGIPKSEAHKASMKAPKSKYHKAKLAKANLGSKYYHDSIKNYVVKAGSLPEPHWIKGMLPKNKM